MSTKQLFQLSNVIVMPFWLLMIFLPNWKVTRRVMQSPWVAAPPAIIYVMLIARSMAAGDTSENGGDMRDLANPTPQSIARLLGTPQGAATGWAHFVAFDLLVGRWVYLDGQRRGVHPLLMAPVLFFTLMLGPVGFLIYLAIRAVHRS